MSKSPLIAAGFNGKGRTFYRRKNDLVQLVNFQRSNYSDLEYINVAFWPLALGKPSVLLVHKFPIRGRIEDVIETPSASGNAMQQLLDALDGPLASLEGLRQARQSGKLKNLLISSVACALLDE